MGLMLRAEFRRTNRYVAWGAAGRGRLFFLSAQAPLEHVVGHNDEEVHIRSLAGVAFRDRAPDDQSRNSFHSA